MPNPNLLRIQRVSRRFRWLFNVLIISTPIATILFWVFFDELTQGKMDLPITLYSPLSTTSLLLAGIASLLPMSITLYNLITLRNLFRLYEQGIVFAKENAQCFKRLGYSLIAWVIAHIIYIPLLSLALTFENPPGMRAITIQFGILEPLILIIGAIVVFISWIMREATKLEDEQAYTV